MVNPLFDEKQDGISNYSAALLIQACIWLAVVLVLHKVYAFVPLTVALIFFGFGDFVFRFICVRLAIERGVEVAKVSDVLTDQYLREVDVYDRLRLYVVLYGGAFLAGIFCILLSLIIRSESFLLVGGLCSIAAFLKLVPVYPTDGGLLVVQAMRLDEPNMRIMFESAGFIALSLLLSMIFSPVLGFVLLIPALLLPVRYRSLQAKYALLYRVEEHINKSDKDVTDEEMEEVIMASPEMKSLELVYEEEDCGFFVESLIQEVPRRPLVPEQRRKLNGLYLMTLCLQMFFLVSTVTFLFDTGEGAVRGSLASQDCRQASEHLNYFRPVLQLSGRYKKLKKDVSGCGVIMESEPQSVLVAPNSSPLTHI